MNRIGEGVLALCAKKNVTMFVVLFSFLFALIGCKKEMKTVKKNNNTKAEKFVSFKNKGHELVFAMVQKVGDYQKLRAKKDVVYTYKYSTPDGKTDVSTEKYIFERELSYGEYKVHTRTLSTLKGVIEQGYDGENYWLKQNGNLIKDSIALKQVAFNRPTNFYWFTMFQKLLDDGVLYKYLGTKKIDGVVYEIVKISFESEKPTDVYQLYINKNTGLVDQFLFTVVDFNVVQTPLLMRLKYENIEGFLIPTTRKYKKSTWDAEVTDTPWIHVKWAAIKFNNHLKKEEFTK